MKIRPILLAIALSTMALAAHAQTSFGQSRQQPNIQAQGYPGSNNNNPGGAGGQGTSGRTHRGPVRLPSPGGPSQPRQCQ